MRRYKLSPGSNFQVAVDVERLLRIMDRMPELKLFTQVDGDNVFPLADEEDGHLAEVLEKHGDITIQFNLNRSN